MKVKRFLISVFTLAVLMTTQFITVSAAETESDGLPSTIISNDLSVRIPVSKMSESNIIQRTTQATQSVKDITPIKYPDMSIYSIIGNPYAIEKSTGELYFFPDVIVGYKTPETGIPRNNMVVNYSVAQTRVFEHALEQYGYEICGWKLTMSFRLNTIYIPKFLEVKFNGEEQPNILLSSNDKNKTLLYEMYIESNPDEPYEGVLTGNLVCSNIDGSAVLFPYACGIRFNQ